MDVLIRPSRVEDAPAFSEAVTRVATEKRYLATVDGYTVEQTRSYLQRAAEGLLYQFVAEVDGRVIGACDISPRQATGFTHVGVLGMFLLPEWRARGIGRQLLEACLSAARSAGLERIELEVFADNEAAIQLYEAQGFVREGRKVHGRKFEGRYQDVLLMALALNSPAVPGAAQGVSR
jgi:RimJ/RimL family protein N-acetyltransferase